MVLLRYRYLYIAPIWGRIMDLEILRKIGLSSGEIKIYSALLDLGVSPLQKIHEKTGIERRNIYDILNKLIEKGLVSYIEENKRRSFQISHPHKVIGYIEEKKKEWEALQKEMHERIPVLVEKFNAKKPKIRAEVYRGVEGIKAVWEDMLHYPETRWVGSGRYVPKKFPFFFEKWNKRRIKAKVKWQNLMRHEMRVEAKDMSYEKMKFLPIEFSGNPAVIAIYGNKVAQFLYGENLFAFVIESKELADNYRDYHQYLWVHVAKS